MNIDTIGLTGCGALGPSEAIMKDGQLVPGSDRPESISGKQGRSVGWGGGVIEFSVMLWRQNRDSISGSSWLPRILPGTRTHHYGVISIAFSMSPWKIGFDVILLTVFKCIIDAFNLYLPWIYAGWDVHCSSAFGTVTYTMDRTI